MEGFDKLAEDVGAVDYRTIRPGQSVTPEMKVVEIQPPTFTAQTYKRSTDFAKLASALAKAQSTMQNPARDHKAEVPTKSGGKYTYTYSDLAAVLDCAKPSLNSNGIAIMQPLAIVRGHEVTVTTLLVHDSGQWFQIDLDMRAGDTTPQAVGSAITYGRRYGACALIGIAPADDDDGRAASGPGHQAQAQARRGASRLSSTPPPPGPQEGLSADESRKKLLAAFEKLKAQFQDVADYETKLQSFGVNHPEEFDSRETALTAYRAIEELLKRTPARGVVSIDQFKPSADANRGHDKVAPEVLAGPGGAGGSSGASDVPPPVVPIAERTYESWEDFHAMGAPDGVVKLTILSDGVFTWNGETYARVEEPGQAKRKKRGADAFDFGGKQ